MRPVRLTTQCTKGRKENNCASSGNCFGLRGLQAKVILAILAASRFSAVFLSTLQPVACSARVSVYFCEKGTPCIRSEIGIAMPETAESVQLAPATLAAFDLYFTEAELAMQPCFEGLSPSLLPELKPELSQRVREGQICAELWSGKGPTHVPDGLIHDWIGTAFVPGGTLATTLTLIQNYDNHKNIFKPEVVDSRLLSREGNDFEILLRLRKKKVVTVVLDSWHHVHYSEISPTRWTCRSHTTSIREIEHAGTAKEVALATDAGHGYMWRLNSYWNFEERDAGMWLECRAISLSRDIPKGLAWIIEPIIRKLPRESLIRTLQSTRQALFLEETPPMSATEDT